MATTAVPAAPASGTHSRGQFLRGLPWAALGAATAVVAGWALWYAVAWVSYGHAARGGTPDLLLDRFVPAYDVRERHAITVGAPLAATWGAALAVDMERAPVVHAIFGGRRLLLANSDSATSHLRLGDLEAIGWGRLAFVPGREIVFGAVTQPWKGDVTFQPLAPDAFAAFDTPGYVKIAWTIAVDSLGPDRSRFRTETRVITTDAESRARFRRYWSAFSPGILLIRWQMLRLVRADAERGGVSRP
jgi:hypothetical protein